MAAQTIKPVIKKLKVGLKNNGFPKCRFFIFGSHARNETHADSDIDICLVSETFKQHRE
jgi:predicted nucleotidyltransferase